MFFWWQAGCVTALQERFDLSSARFAGASAGAITCALAACNCDVGDAFHSAKRIAENEGLLSKGSWSLLGAWGPMIRTWLDHCLPFDAHKLCTDRVTIAIRQLPWLETVFLSQFPTKGHLIDACLASAHVPFLLDGRLSANIGNARFIDGSFAGASRHLLKAAGASALRFNAYDDPVLMQHVCRYSGFMKFDGVNSVRWLVELGEDYIRRLDAKEENHLGAMQPWRKT